MKTKTIASLMSATVVAFQSSRDAQAITHASLDEEHASVVALSYTGEIGCTGTVIAKRVVITAAHCVSPEPPDLVYVGGHPSQGAGHAIRVSRARPLPSFRNTDLYDDVAVLGLENDAPVPLIDVAFDDSLPSGDGRLLAVGFGATQRADRGERHRRQGVVAARLEADGTLSLRGDPSQPCGGDSGAPLLNGQGRIVGIVSLGDAQCASNARATSFTGVGEDTKKLVEWARAEGDRASKKTHWPASMTIGLAILGLVVVRRRFG